MSGSSAPWSREGSAGGSPSARTEMLLAWAERLTRGEELLARVWCSRRGPGRMAYRTSNQVRAGLSDRHLRGVYEAWAQIRVDSAWADQEPPVRVFGPLGSAVRDGVVVLHAERAVWGSSLAGWLQVLNEAYLLVEGRRSMDEKHQETLLVLAGQWESSVPELVEAVTLLEDERAL